MSLWRYREVLPVPDPPVTLREGLTPLVRARDDDLLLKMRFLCEQLGGRAPEWVVAPVGHGTLFLGPALGLRDPAPRASRGAPGRRPALI